jgi:hypothetical protein
MKGIAIVRTTDEQLSVEHGKNLVKPTSNEKPGVCINIRFVKEKGYS